MTCAAFISASRRRRLALGMQARLIVGFMALLLVGLGTSCWLFISQGMLRIDDTLGEQARQIAYALSRAGQTPLDENDLIELRRIGQDMLQARNVGFVAFADARGEPLAVASRELIDPRAMLSETNSLLLVRRVPSPGGELLRVMAPVIATNSETGGTRLLGYVAVGISPGREQAQFQRVTYVVAVIGVGLFILSLPVAYLLVHRICQPIVQLKQATNRLADGDLDVRVHVMQRDVVGELAEAFNAMADQIQQQQEALALANQVLEQKVQQRTAELESANQRLSREIAEKEEFLRAVSHDLNAPLRNISGMATTLLMKHRQTLDQDIVHRLERIQKNVEMETELIGELLELSRIKTRRQKIEPVDVSELVDELRGLFENDLKQKSIQLITDTPLRTLQAERARLRQVLQNLIDNAIKYMGEGSIADGQRRREIRVGCEDHGHEVEFYVADSGMGIDPADVDKIFCVFRRGKSGAAQAIPGKGVGLASVKSIIETYEGRIWVTSTPGQGSTFHFTIPARFVVSAAAEPVLETAGV